MKQKLTYFITLFVLILPNLVLAVTEQVAPAGRVAGVALPLGVYWLLLSLSRRTGRTAILLFPAMFLGAFQMVLTYLYGRGPIAVDMWLNLVTTNPGEVNELLSQLLPAIVWVVVVYVPAIALGAVAWAKRWDVGQAFLRRNRRAALCLTAAAAAFTAVAVGCTPYSVASDLFPANAVYNFGMALQRNSASQAYADTSRGFTYGARCTFPKDSAETIVLVIGETSRADDWQLYGYRRPTNPRLSRQEGLTVFTDYMSQSNTTHKSVPILLSPADASDYSLLYRTKGIMAAFGEAGYHTVFISNQQRNHSFIDFLGEQADESLFLRDAHPGNAYDTDLLRPLAATLARHRGQRTFVVLHTYGSHFSYADRYPASARAFTPDSYDGAKAKYRPQLVNAYDNSIRLTDSLLAEVIALAGQGGGSAAMVYTADHGEDIFDDHRHYFLHASPFPSFWQLHVPLVVWASPLYRQRHADLTAALKANRSKAAESNSVFHTLLTMGGVSTRYRADSLSLASRAYREHTRLFIDDHNRPRTYDECMMKEDMALMRQKHISCRK